ncbi:hypothetical protein P3L10_028352 [Capsicum annuum]
MRSDDIETVKQSKIEDFEEKRVEKPENGGEKNKNAVVSTWSSGDENWEKMDLKKSLCFSDYYKAFDLEDLLKESTEVLVKGLLE